MTIAAIIWDFDGTILDTEWPAFVAASAEYERYGRTIPRQAWADTLGTADHEPWWEHLRRDIGGFDEPDEVLLGRYRALKNELTDASSLMPGVEDRFTEAERLGLTNALASSSPIEWVERHTRTHGLWDRLSAVATRTDVGQARTKPEPDLFLLAAERAQLDPSQCLVIEDSHHGVTAAKRAGMRVVAVPNRLTQTHDFADADEVVHSLTALDLPRLLVTRG